MVSATYRKPAVLPLMIWASQNGDGIAVRRRCTYISQEEEPVDIILGVHVVRGSMQWHRDRGDEAGPFDSDFVDKRASEQRAYETACVAQAGR